MKKSVSNAIIDSTSLLCGALLLVTGSILAFVLPHRSGKIGLSWLTMPRHSWAEMHYYISIVFCVLILLHLVLHWSFIKALAWGTANNPRPISVRISVLFVASLLVLLVILPFLIPAQTSQVSELGRGHFSEVR